MDKVWQALQRQSGRLAGIMTELVWLDNLGWEI
jgi:hypothetical protein